jgi:hypothetical protein
MPNLGNLLVSYKTSELNARTGHGKKIVCRGYPEIKWRGNIQSNALTPRKIHCIPSAG